MAGQTSYPNVKSTPVWAKDFGGREHVMAFAGRVNPYAFTDANGVVVTTTALAAAAAVAIPVTALARAIPRHTILFFGETGEIARLSADAAAGAVSLAVDPLPNAIESGDVAVYSPYGRRALKSGTLVGRTYAERDANTAFEPAASTDDEFYLVLFDKEDLFTDANIELYRPGGQVAENYLPDWATISTNAPLLAKLRAVYQCIKGVD